MKLTADSRQQAQNAAARTTAAGHNGSNNTASLGSGAVAENSSSDGNLPHRQEDRYRKLTICNSRLISEQTSSEMSGKGKHPDVEDDYDEDEDEEEEEEAVKNVAKGKKAPDNHDEDDDDDDDEDDDEGDDDDDEEEGDPQRPTMKDLMTGKYNLQDDEEEDDEFEVSGVHLRVFFS